jgi:small subunit ribosomal protein S1
VKKGDVISAKVIKVDPEHKKVALSIKEYLIERNQVNRDDIIVGAKSSKKRVKKKDDDEEDDEETSKKKRKKEEETSAE